MISRGFSISDVLSDLKKQVEGLTKKAAGVFGTLFLAHVSTLFLSLLSSVLIANSFSSQTFGDFQLIMSLVNIVGTFCLNGMGTSMTVSAARRIDGNLSRLVWIQILAGVVGSLGLVGISGYYWWTDRSVYIGFLAMALFFPFVQLQKMLFAWFVGKERWNLLASFQIGQGFLVLGLLYLLVLGEWFELSYLIVAMHVAVAAITVAGFIYCFQSRENQDTDASVIRFGYHATLSGAIMALVSTDRFILYEKISSEALAIYSVALVFPLQLRALFHIINKMLTPELARCDGVDAAWKYLKGRLLGLLFLFASVGLLGFFLIPPTIGLLYPERYVQAAELGKWIWLAIALSLPFCFVGSLLRAQQKVRFNYFFDFGIALGSFLLFLTLIEYGLHGMVWAQALRSQITPVVCFIGLWFYLRSERNQNSNLSPT